MRSRGELINRSAIGKNRMKAKILVFMSVATSILGFGLVSSPLARATPTLSISDGVTSLVITDETAADFDSGMPGVVGDFSVSGFGSGWSSTFLVTAFTKPNSGSSGQPNLELHFGGLSTGVGNTLTLTFSDNAFGPLSGTVSSGIGGNGAANVTFKTYADAGNVLFAQTALLTSEGPFGGTYSDNAWTNSPVGSPYSLTMQVVLTTTGAGNVGFDAFMIVPEPSAWMLCALGFAGASLIGWRRRG
jgi:hypothetical protein